MDFCCKNPSERDKTDPPDEEEDIATNHRKDVVDRLQHSPLRSVEETGCRWLANPFSFRVCNSYYRGTSFFVLGKSLSVTVGF